MFSSTLTVHEGLGRSGRLRSGAAADRAVSVAEIGSLLALGIATAVLAAYVKPSLGVPGSNILFVVLPVATGLALVPRHGTGSLIGLAATSSAGLFCIMGARVGLGALTSLALTGVLIDVALHRARSGRGIYIRLMAAGLAANTAAFLIKAGSKLLLGPGLSGKPLAFWWQHALLTYAVCGLLAGAIGAAVWFRFGGGDKANASVGTPS